MLKKTKSGSKSECAVCYTTHDEEIHQATLRIHQWFYTQVTRHFDDDEFLALEMAPEGPAN